MSGSELLVAMTRGGIVESEHRGWVAVAKADGTLHASCGDPERVTFARSAMKPFQAVAAIESGAAGRFGFGDQEIAVACASHNGEGRHREVVKGILDSIGLPPGALRAGEDGYKGEPKDRWDPEKQLAQNCSGKHAAMLAACLARDFSVHYYDELDHPIQVEIRGIVSRFWQVPEGELIAGQDNCTLPAYAAPLRSIATGWAGIANPDQAPAEHREAIIRIADAMAAEPFMVAGTGRLNTELMTVTKGRILAKDGAEGVLCLAVRDSGLGIAFKVQDGSFRSHQQIALSILRQIGALTDDEDEKLSALWRADLRSNRNHHVGDIVPQFELRFTNG